MRYPPMLNDPSSSTNNTSFLEGLAALINGNYSESFELLAPLAENGDASAQSALAHLYYEGLGVDQDYKTAKKWYELAAKQGHIHAQNNLGCLYENGEGVTQNLEEASKFYRLSAEQGCAGAQSNLGQMYRSGLGVAKNDLEAVKW